MSKIQPRTLSGFMELLPARQAQFDRMVEILRETYSLYGFTPLDTPLIEASEGRHRPVSALRPHGSSGQVRGP